MRIEKETLKSLRKSKPAQDNLPFVILVDIEARPPAFWDGEKWQSDDLLALSMPYPQADRFIFEEKKFPDRRIVAVYEYGTKKAYVMACWKANEHGDDACAVTREGFTR